MEWISTEDKAPDEGRFLAFVLSSGEVEIVHACEAKWGRFYSLEYATIQEPKYWIPLPKPPTLEAYEASSKEQDSFPEN